MTTVAEGDVAAALARLESGATHGETAADDAPPADSEPRTELDAVRLWLADVGCRPGGTMGPSIGRMSDAYARHAASQGWGFDWVGPSLMGRTLRRLGYRVHATAGSRGALMNRDAARRLWAEVPREERPKRPRKHRSAPQRAALPRAPLFWACLADGRRARTAKPALAAKPLVDTLGRVWPSARVAASLLPHAHHRHIQECASGKVTRGVGGVLWRYLTPDEVRLVPPMHRAGQVLPEFAWGLARAVAMQVSCPCCGASECGRWRGAHPPPPGFPTHPHLESPAGGPTHMPTAFSDGPTHTIASISAHPNVVSPQNEVAKDTSSDSSPPVSPYGTVPEP